MILTLPLPAADIISDVALVAAPLHLWRDVGLSRNRKIVILSAFSASLLIVVVTIPHNVILIKCPGRTTLIFAHVKVSTLSPSVVLDLTSHGD